MTEQAYTAPNFQVGGGPGWGGNWGGFGFSGGIPPVGLFGILGRDRGKGGKKDHCEMFFLQSLMDKNDNHARDLGEIKKDIAERVGDARSALQSEICETKSKIFEVGARIVDKMTGEFREVQEELCCIKTQILENKFQLGIAIEKSKQDVLDKLASNRESDLKDKIDELRHEKQYDRYNYGLNALFSEFQNQRQSNRTIQFGNANTSDSTNKQQQVG